MIRIIGILFIAATGFATTIGHAESPYVQINCSTYRADLTIKIPRTGKNSFAESGAGLEGTGQFGMLSEDSNHSDETAIMPLYIESERIIFGNLHRIGERPAAAGSLSLTFDNVTYSELVAAFSSTRRITMRVANNTLKLDEKIEPLEKFDVMTCLRKL